MRQLCAQPSWRRAHARNELPALKCWAATLLYAFRCRSAQGAVSASRQVVCRGCASGLARCNGCTYCGCLAGRACQSSPPDFIEDCAAFTRQVDNFAPFACCWTGDLKLRVWRGRRPGSTQADPVRAQLAQFAARRPKHARMLSARRSRFCIGQMHQ